MPQWAVVVLWVLGILLVVLAITELPAQHRFIDSAGKADPSKLKSWLAKGRDPNKPGLFGLTALGSASMEGQYESVELLLSHGASPNHREGKVQPLQMAVDNGHLKIARLLLEHGAELDRPALFKVTPLEDAVINLKLEAVKLYIEFGANLNAKTSKGDPLLVFLVEDLAITRKPAKRDAIRQMVKLFLDHGANPNVRSKGDVPVLYPALEDAETLRMLVDAGAITDVSYEGLDLEPLIDTVLSSEISGDSAKEV